MHTVLSELIAFVSDTRFGKAVWSIFLAFLPCGTFVSATEVNHNSVQAPKYCDLGGRLNLENCSLVNSVLAEDFFRRAIRSRSVKAADAQRIAVHVRRQCDDVQSRSRKGTGGGSMDEVQTRECLADGFHAAATHTLGRREGRYFIHGNSDERPFYCSGPDCEYVNRLIAVDFYRRAALGKTPVLGVHATVEEVTGICDARKPDSTKYDADLVAESLVCARDQLHKAALQLLRK